MRVVWWIAMVSVLAAPAVEAAPTRELVVLVHGMGRTALSMKPLERVLERAGYDVLNFGYSSFCCTVEELGGSLRAAVDARLAPEHGAVHFVGHSLGGILIRHVLTRETPPPRVGRVVLLAPPNRGSRAADRYAGLVGWLLRPIRDLRTDDDAAVRRLPRVEDVPIAVISGARDGKVSLDEARLDEASAHIVVDAYHSFLMRRRDVHDETLAFLRTGRFSAAAEPSPRP